MEPRQRARDARHTDLQLARVMRALGDPARLSIAKLLADGRRRTSGEIAAAVGMPLSTCSYHLSQLLAAGVTECFTQGTARYPTLRRDALDATFPGLVALIEASG